MFSDLRVCIDDRPYAATPVSTLFDCSRLFSKLHRDEISTDEACPWNATSNHMNGFMTTTFISLSVHSRHSARQSSSISPRLDFLRRTCRCGRIAFVVRVRGGNARPSRRRTTMAQYLLSVHSVDGEIREPMSDEEMQQSWKQIQVLEEEMKSVDALVFSGRLTEPDTATVLRPSGGEVLTTDGPFAESKEHLGGFYIIEAKDLDAALAWASKTTAAVSKPIEVRPFRHVSEA